MKIRGDFYPFVYFTAWLFLVGWVVKESHASDWWFILAGLAPIPIAVAYESWKEDKAKKD